MKRKARRWLPWCAHALNVAGCAAILAGYPAGEYAVCAAALLDWLADSLCEN
jgi:hypothetical protein